MTYTGEHPYDDTSSWCCRARGDGSIVIRIEANTTNSSDDAGCRSEFDVPLPPFHADVVYIDWIARPRSRDWLLVIFWIRWTAKQQRQVRYARPMQLASSYG